MPDPICQRLWPEGRKTIRINEASRLIEPGLGEPPRSEYYKARIAHQHSLEIAPSAREHQRMLDTASLRNDTETYMRLEMERVARTRTHEENDGSLEDAIVRSIRAEVDLPRDIVRRAKLLNVQLIPPDGLGVDEPDETWFLDQAGFAKICEAILSFDEPIGERAGSESRASYTGRLARRMKHLFKNGTLPDDDGDIEKEFRRWYEDEREKNGWPLLPQPRAVKTQLKRIRRRLADGKSNSDL